MRLQPYQLQCSVTGRVKMYRHMSQARAEVLDGVLHAQGSTCRWVLRGGARTPEPGRVTVRVARPLKARAAPRSPLREVI